MFQCYALVALQAERVGLSKAAIQQPQLEVQIAVVATVAVATREPPLDCSMPLAASMLGTAVVQQHCIFLHPAWVAREVLHCSIHAAAAAAAAAAAHQQHGIPDAAHKNNHPQNSHCRHSPNSSPASSRCTNKGVR